MFMAELHNTNLYINGARIVDLKKPFQRIVGNHGESISKILRAPQESLSRKKRPLTYYVKFSEYKAGALFNSDIDGLKCHWVYNTNPSISPLFRDKVLLSLVNLLDTPMEIYGEICQYLRSIIMLLWKSFSFDCIYSSIRTLPFLLSYDDIPIITAPLNLVRLPKKCPWGDKDITSGDRGGRNGLERYKILQAILKGHPKGIPLSILTGTSYNLISLVRDTTFNRDILKGKKNILIVESTNTAYAGFLSREISSLPGVKETLPVCFFHINKE